MPLRYLSAFVLLCTLASCDGTPSGMDLSGPTAESRRNAVDAEGCTRVGNYDVCSEAQGNADGTTKFVFTTTHRGGPKMNYFFLEIPPDLLPDLVSYAPSRAVKVGPNVDRPSYNGITWKPASNDEFAITFRGNVGSGVTTSIIRSGAKVRQADVIGPSSTGFVIAGSVYTDTDDPARPEYLTREFPELGIPGVVVSLYHADGTPVVGAGTETRQQTTDGSGVFRFDGLAHGYYQVRVEAGAGSVNALLFETFEGEALYDYTQGTFTPGGDAYFAVPASQLSTDDVHLGFVPQAGPVVSALEAEGSPYAPTNELAFPRFLPLLYGLVSPAEIQSGTFESLVATAGTYEIGFLGRELRPAGTIYRYVIRGSGGEFDASHLTIEQDPSCVPDDVHPEGTGDYGTDPTTGLYGISYDLTDLGDGQMEILLAYRGTRPPGVVKFGVRSDSDVQYVDMPGACVNAIASEAHLREGLDAVFYSGAVDDTFLYLQDPLLNGGLSDLAAGIDLLSRPASEDPAKGALFTTYARQLLLISELVYFLGSGPQHPVLAATIHQYAEPIIGAASASKVGGAAGPVASTGGMEDIPRVLRATF